MTTFNFQPVMAKSTLERMTEDPSEVRPKLLGDSAGITALRGDIETAARSDAKVLIAGETGVGKEVVSRLIHQDGARRRHPFAHEDCADTHPLNRFVPQFA